ncbi:MAG: hypothetical protein P8J87_19535, partial [Verrucomicrobiales bacterium]|nr:hypothetical protein [Verrucomicrobiales bacterium]
QHALRVTPSYFNSLLTIRRSGVAGLGIGAGPITRVVESLVRRLCVKEERPAERRGEPDSGGDVFKN